MEKENIESENQEKEKIFVLKINAGFNKPLYVKVDDINLSVEEIITEAIENLRKSGDLFKAQSLQKMLEQRYKDKPSKISKI